MAADSPDLVIAKRLLDHVKAQGFQFQRVAEGPDGALLGTRDTVEWTDTVYLDGFSRGCYAMRERKRLSGDAEVRAGQLSRHAAATQCDARLPGDLQHYQQMGPSRYSPKLSAWACRWWRHQH